MTDAFQSLQGLLLSLADVESFLQRLADLAAGVFDGSAACGITLRHNAEPFTVASSDERASAMDESQYDSAEGPCLHAMYTGGVVWVADINQEKERWPEYVARAADGGLSWSLSLPLTWPDHSQDSPGFGAVNLYGFDDTAQPDVDQRRQCEIFAAQVSGAVLLARSTIQAVQHRQQLEAALSSRTVIDQALGMLMAQQRCTADEAFRLLQMRSQHSNTKLRDVAADLIQRITGQPPRPGAPFTA